MLNICTHCFVFLQVSEPLVTAKLGQVLKRTGDWRNPRQLVQRLGITTRQLSHLVNNHEVGLLAADMCCRCGLLIPSPTDPPVSAGSALLLQLAFPLPTGLHRDTGTASV